MKVFISEIFFGKSSSLNAMYVGGRGVGFLLLSLQILIRDVQKCATLKFFVYKLTKSLQLPTPPSVVCSSLLFGFFFLKFYMHVNKYIMAP